MGSPLAAAGAFGEDVDEAAIASSVARGRPSPELPKAVALRARRVVVESSSDVLGRWAEMRPGGGGMFKLFLLSIVVVPVLIGMRVASGASRRRGLLALAALLLAYDMLYVLNLYFLRVRWVGWGGS